ncbi:hypothetical protein B7494_g68 [Chlorociboria aeruginascens]|nr:hypothetical protein B7494_g68 [Chlorociboria aeruginascens]
MVKKRVRDAEVENVFPGAVAVQFQDGKDGASDSDEDMNEVNVDFEWFNFKEIDFHGVKSLLQQLFDVDSQLLDLSALANLILSQPTIGSTVKVDGEETDPYAFLTALNVYEHRENEAIKKLVEYIIKKARTNQALASLPDLLSSSGVGLILTERLINVPAEVAPAMYGFLTDELEAAVEDKEPYDFTHYLIISKTYREIESALDQEDAPKSKKNKAGRVSKETFYFHPEDEILQRHALAYGTYEYTKDGGEGMADSKRAFQDMGIKSQGSMIFIEAGKFDGAIKATSEYLNVQNSG